MQEMVMSPKVLSHSRPKKRFRYIKGPAVLLLGDKHNFNPHQKEKLQKRFDGVKRLSVENLSDQQIIGTINQHLPQNGHVFVVLNLNGTVGPELFTYLSKLKLRGVILLPFARFQEYYLQEAVLPTEDSNPQELSQYRAYKFLSYLGKRVIDLAAATVLTLVSLPVMIYAAIQIKRQSPGRIFFTQERVGKNGKTFTCFKFRSMHENCEFNPYTQDEDPRIYPFGNWMRKSRVDELPQLINVFKGDMHLVGPRAEWNILADQYAEEIPHYHTRHKVRPGITGWAQVNYGYGANLDDTKQKLMYDLYYIKNWDPILEIEIMIKTVLVMVLKKGK